MKYNFSLLLRRFFGAVFLCLIALGLWSYMVVKDIPRILVFSKTAAFRHSSIGAGQKALFALGKQNDFAVDTTENAGRFSEENLRKYQAVVFLNTTGDVLNPIQQNAFERYIQAGGGYLGIHAAADTEYEWPWYNKLAGAWFESHPNPDNVQKGTFVVVDKNHPATSFLPEKWERTDEFYSYKNISPAIKVLLKIDEKTYRGGTNGDNHPMAWYQEFEGGRSFYTAGGHTDASFAEPLFLKHLAAGLNYVMGGNTPKPLDYTKAKTKRMPEENRFAKVILEEKLDEPMELTVLPDNRVLFIERKGKVKLFSPATGKTKVIANIPVNTKVTDKEGKTGNDEAGLLSLTKDPGFAQNGWIYLYYAPEGKEPKNILTRYQLKGDELVMDSKKVLLEVATQREISGHAGGSLTFDAKGNLYLSTGDNINPHGSNGFSPSDERPGREPFDAQMTSGNTNDLRGKILRIHPEKDGTYTIPEGNLFPKGTPKTRLEIYTMGHRNPYRISVDPKTSFLYWGDIGPDASKPGELRGPEGFDEIGQARKAGNYGWPYFVGDNKAYYKYDFAANKSGEIYNPEKPINNSLNNTGLNQLPPAQKAFIWYSYAESKEFPLVGAGGRSAMAGPMFYADQFKTAKRAFPDYYDGKLFIYEWMRGWLMAVTLDKEGNYSSMERIMPSYKFSNPVDIEFGPEGDLYMLEYGSGWFTQNDDARLVRIEYNAGNRKPVIQLATDKKGGALPFKAHLSSKGTKDADNDALKYVWKVTAQNGGTTRTFNEANPTVTFDKAGIYKATLTVTDAKGANSSQSLEIMAGNEEPVLTFKTSTSNQTFFFPNQPLEYEVKVSDKEDGSLDNGKIKPEEVAITFDYLPEGFDIVSIAQGHRSADASAGVVKGLKLIQSNDCKACHSIDKKSVGPAYQQVALKYKNDSGAAQRLAKKVISGGSGVWGEVTMSAHPQLAEADAREMVNYILSLADAKQAATTLPVKGSYNMTIPSGDKGEGFYVVRAAYKDKGSKSIPSISAEKIMTLRNAKLPAGKAEKIEGVMKYGTIIIASTKGSSIGFSNLDLTGIEQIKFTASAPKAQLNAAGGRIEVHLDSPTGKLVGQTAMISPPDGTNKTGTPDVVAKLSGASGIHDVYFVFQNEKAPAGQALMVVMNLEFQTSKSASMSAAPVTQAVPGTSVAAKNLEAYSGKYKMTGLPFEYVEISSKEDKLHLNAGGNEGVLSPGKENDVFEGDSGTQLIFGRNADKKVTTITLKAQGFTFEGTKE
ncbi:ThuA domain-containing protein [Adhaeribacter radiodurans]|uniref:ThuA domain-containing protein n=1 Tax=Adhaeribacter radiodurans TaxID=2745197 RepID=A0A7L7L2F2_9BACT|nr:ThuA domain-containing protein [Adhaeribacter radiodurans]QMU26940.1 ThuA domain-containing protein [Adhaeribacter radiodurans]